MRITPLFLLALITSSAQLGLAQETTPASPASQPDQTVDELSPELASIRAGSEAFVDAFNAHDAQATSALWTEDAEYIDDRGNTYAGRDSIETMYSGFFADNSEVKLQIAIDSIRLIGGTVAIEDGRALVQPAPEGAPGVSKYTAVHVKLDGKWQMASVRDTWIESTVTRESTADLQWLIGTWVAEEHGVHR